ncbi:imelysin family protein [Tenacibaculum sp. SG-28]|uniref:imelysin family protein n=1 Tax=Tenacibaculum sp. SG-28 TaxID=754426 RepID=UPI000CF55E4B|nr:imelysin family protein [Tenacibaculum sp. SG-28]PQJ23392.1 peptidase M75 superfamily protein [Tenacibaculum sp. SG-28]
MKNFLYFLLITSLSVACSSSSEDPDTPDDNYDRSKILTNVADNIIIPAFANFDEKLKTLQEKTTTFTASADENSLEEVRTSWLEALKAWQDVAVFNIGKAEEIGFVNFINIYPTSSDEIESNIESGNYDFSNSNYHDSQGFQALDYLFFGLGETDTAIVAKFTTDVNAAGYRKYANDILSKMTEITTAIVNDWQGGYRDEFVSNSGNTATSSLNKFVNDFIFYYEKLLRANKFGIPAGNFSNTPLPEKVEGYYNQEVSKELAMRALTSIKRLFNGESYGVLRNPGPGFKEYLEALDNATLAANINNQFNTAQTQINTLDNNFYNQINTDNSAMLSAYDELQKAVVMLKVDMLQAFNVRVDYVDADGD